jgi:uncharacterized membrane protein (DUF485 family)
MNIDPHHVGRSVSRGLYFAAGTVVIALLVTGFVLIEANHYVWGIVSILAAAGAIAAVAYRR